MWRCGAIALCLGGSVAALAQSRPCTPEDAQRAEQAVDRLNSWNRIYDWFKEYRQCDDGGPAEGLSEAVARNLVDRWGTLPKLADLSVEDIEFRRFVLKHVDSTLNENDLKKIRVNAASRCPTGLRQLCLDLRDRAAAQ